MFFVIQSSTERPPKPEKHVIDFPSERLMPTVFGPFESEFDAIDYVQDLVLAGRAPEETREFIFEANEIDITIDGTVAR